MKLIEIKCSEVLTEFRAGGTYLNGLTQAKQIIEIVIANVSMRMNCLTFRVSMSFGDTK